MFPSGDTPSTSTIIRGNVTLLLSEENVAWKLEKGTVAVFAVRAYNNTPTGPRRYLFSCSRGDCLFGSRPHSATDGLCFLVVGLEDSEVTPMPFHSLLPVNGATAGSGVPYLDAWTRRVCTVVAQGEVHGYAERAHTDSPIALAAQQGIKPPADTVLWANVVSGKLSLGDEQNLVTPDIGWVPVSDDLRLVAGSDSEVRFRPSAAIGSGEAYLAGLQFLHHACFRRLQRLEKEERNRDAERLTERRQIQELETSTAFNELGGVVSNRPPATASDDELMVALTAIGGEVGISFRQPSQSADQSRDIGRLEGIARASRVRVRYVRLRGEWWKRDVGPILGMFGEESRPVALVRDGERYVLVDRSSGVRRPVDSKLDEQLSRDAVTFITPLPDKANSLAALGRFAVSPIFVDLSIILALALATTILGMLVPISTGLVIDEAIPDANIRLLYQLAAGLIVMAFAQAALSFSQGTIFLRVDTKTTARLQAAVIDRLLRVPARFFRRFSSGDIQNRAMMITEISREVSYNAAGGILTGAMAILNLAICVYYDARLAVVAVVSALLISISTAVLSVFVRGAARKLSLGHGKLFGFQVQLISGITKLRVAGAEVRAFNHWALRIADQLRLANRIQRLEHWGSLINTGLQLAATICLYYFAATGLAAVASGNAPGAVGMVLLTMGTFLAFYAAFQKLIGGLTDLSNRLVELGDSWAKRHLVTPLLEEPPENDGTKVDPGTLQGALSVAHISFRYRDDGPLVLNDISLHANPGQFIAIVGPSGCGKSTLLRILLGFESSEAGTVCYDGQDVSGLDLTAVRRQIGVVLQSGVINAGSIYENIAGAARVSFDEAWEAARAAGLANDIEQMPMGMHTFVTEGGGTFSGGQRQRLLIARALVMKPKILIFDEATSALDNRTQQIVTESLDRLQVTRIVVAHRLSTIRDANRVYVMDDGHVVQSGTVEELAAQDGLFRRMIARQLA
jgi:NHLM bacteriocin system ABC transporter ATP-binding protein